MWRILCDSTDASALWAAHGLKARDLEALGVMTGDWLVQSQG
jgi:hypothetical protein